MTAWRLIADVGGTNVRFGRVFDEDNVVERYSYPVAQFDSFLDALRAYADDTGGLGACSRRHWRSRTGRIGRGKTHEHLLVHSGS